MIVIRVEVNLACVRTLMSRIKGIKGRDSNLIHRGLDVSTLQDPLEVLYLEITDSYAPRTREYRFLFDALLREISILRKSFLLYLFQVPPNQLIVWLMCRVTRSDPVRRPQICANYRVNQ